MIRTRIWFSVSTALAVVGLIAGVGLVGGCSSQRDAGTVKINKGAGGPGGRFSEDPADVPLSAATPLDLEDSVQARGMGGR